VINLARQADLTRLLPAAFYDLSRQKPSACAAGFPDPDAGTPHRLSGADLVALFQGRESASRFLSTFIVQALEARGPAPACAAPRACQAIFERVAQEAVGDVGGAAADPLRAMERVLAVHFADADAPALVLLCAHCAEALEEDVQGAREMLWDNLPGWFGVEGIQDWGN
jgi:hypothetical protein